MSVQLGKAVFQIKTVRGHVIVCLEKDTFDTAIPDVFLDQRHEPGTYPLPLKLRQNAKLFDVIIRSFPPVSDRTGRKGSELSVDNNSVLSISQRVVPPQRQL